MTAVGVIPARYGSTRFPGKPLAQILGVPLLEWVIRSSLESQRLSQLIVATDHSEIAQLAVRCGAIAVMTDSDLPSGSDRVWAAVAELDVDVVVNIQGDEPLIEPALIDCLVACFENSTIDMATLGQAMTSESLASSHTAKIVVNRDDEALYFSRLSIPYSRTMPSQDLRACLKHIGIYAYRKNFLRIFCEQTPVAIEMAEGLEQLRALYLGAKIKVVRVQHDGWGVDIPEDIVRVEPMLRRKLELLGKEKRRI